MLRHMPIALIITSLLAGCASTPPPPTPAPRPQAAAVQDPYALLTPGEVALAATTMQEALETDPDGKSRSWTNEATGRAGTIKPVRTYVTRNGYYCRAYQEELRSGPKRERFRHDACRNEKGLWLWL
jgi:surface antigen